MKYKTPESMFLSPSTRAEKVAEAVYYACPNVDGGAVEVIPKTAPVIEKALVDLLEKVEAICSERLTEWDKKATKATLLNGGQLQARRAEALEIGSAIRKIREELNYDTN